MKYWIALCVVCAVAMAGLTACGGGDDSNDDARSSAIGALSENAVDAWVSDGAAGLRTFLDSSVADHCTAAGLTTALANQAQPTAWRNTKDFLFPTANQATATVIIVSGGNDVPQTWTFNLEGGVRWRISDLPGLSGCTS